MAETPTFTMRLAVEHQPLLREICRFVRTRPDGAALVRRFLDEADQPIPEAPANFPASPFQPESSGTSPASDAFGAVLQRITALEEQAEAERETLRQEFATATAQTVERVTDLAQRITSLEQESQEMRDSQRQQSSAVVESFDTKLAMLTQRVTGLEKDRDTGRGSRVTDEAPLRDTEAISLPVIRKDEADVTRRIEEAKGRIDALRAEGVSQRGIAQRLNEEGVGTPVRQGKWSQSRVSDFIKAHLPLPP